jgi:hypothetical protein
VTCIVGLEHNGRVIIGADSAGVAGWTQRIRADSKVFVRSVLVADAPAEKMAFGFTSSYRMGDLLRYVVELPEAPRADKDHDERGWLVSALIPAIRAAFKEHGYQKVEHERAEGGTFLIGWRGGLYMVGGDYQVGRSASGFDATGCAEDEARGAMHVLNVGRLQPEQQIRRALEAAEALNAAIAAPFEVVST